MLSLTSAASALSATSTSSFKVREPPRGGTTMYYLSSVRSFDLIHVIILLSQFLTSLVLSFFLSFNLSFFPPSLSLFLLC